MILTLKKVRNLSFSKCGPGGMDVVPFGDLGVSEFPWTSTVVAERKI